MVGELDIFKLDLAALAEHERLGIWLVLDGDVDLLQVEECLHIQQTLAQLAIDGSEEIEGHGELEHQLVHHHQVTNSQGTRGHAGGRQIHHPRQSRGEDDILAAVQKRKRGGNLYRVLLVLLQGVVVPHDLELLVVEVLDGLVVDERVHGQRRPLVISSVGLAPELGPPRRRPDGECRVSRHRQDCDGRKLEAVLPGQDPAHHADLQSRRQQVEHHARQQEADALRTAVQRPRQPSRLLGEVEVEVQAQQVLKHVARDAAYGLLRDAREDGIAQLLEDGRADPGGAVPGHLLHDGPVGLALLRRRLVG
ncbi:unnamed protein product [Clonostachys rosea f. rosea IK726]|uniref:Uncharacterized protein n=1 Tax=Clonostachys rosea f. rosea IK726 TaxID=1349383 RepID=A0ACA9TK30_BIOOC|nr:unnamed protein product [Clonostachys rosea f. rosea IK726]